LADQIRFAPIADHCHAAWTQIARDRENKLWRLRIMKSLIQAVVIAVAVAAPVASFAQSSQNQPLTRAEVRAQLVQLEQAGYNPGRSGRDPYYPADIQAAEAKVAAQNATAQAETTSYGAGSNGSSQAGERAQVTVSPYSPPVVAH
jgi:hypothetical protein